MKGYCVCSKPENAFRPLPGIPGPIFVHTCGFPSRRVWESYFKRCNTCLRLFSNPWEKDCSNCFKELVKYGEVEDRIYNSWTWASRLIYDFTQQKDKFDPSLCASLSLYMEPLPLPILADPAGSLALTSSESCHSVMEFELLSDPF